MKNIQFTFFKFYLALVCACFLILTQQELQAQNEAAPEQKAVFKGTQTAKYNSLLWEVNHPKLKKSSYLYGTMHSRDKRIHAISDSATYYFNSCDAVALELITSEMEKNPFAMIKSMQMEDTTLQDLYSKKDYKIVKKAINDKLGFVGMLFNTDKIKPIFLSSLLSEEISNDAMELPLDMQLQKMGKEQEKVLIGIETVAEQMGALDALSLKQQAAMLLEQINNEADNGDDQMQEMVALYLAQDLDGLLLFYDKQKGTMPDEFDKALVVKRNHIMAQRMDSIANLQTTFMAVGALHLPGQEGVIELLRKRGFTVRAVYSAHGGKGITSPTTKRKPKAQKAPPVASPSPTNPKSTKKSPIKKETTKKGTTFTANSQLVYADSLWQLLNAPQSRLEVMLPSKNETIEHNQEGAIRSYKYIDKVNDLQYAITHQRKKAGKTAQQFVEETFTPIIIAKGGNLQIEEEIRVNGSKAVTGYVRPTQKSNELIRFQVIRAGYEYYLQLLTGAPEQVNSPAVDKYFSSIRLVLD